MHARFGVLILLPLMVSAAHGTDIYKCTDKNGTVSYGDMPCPSQKTTLLHKETPEEADQAKKERMIIALNAMIDSGHLDEARTFAAANGASAHFQERVQANVIREQDQRRQEMANDAEARRASDAADQARRQQAMQDQQTKLMQADAEQEKFRKEHWTEIKQQHPDEVLRDQSVTFNPARSKWCSVNKDDGSTVCQ
jgi:hypothetical protein